MRLTALHFGGEKPLVSAYIEKCVWLAKHRLLHNGTGTTVAVGGAAAHRWVAADLGGWGVGTAQFWPAFSIEGASRTRRGCEDALALAFAALAAARQNDLLAPVANPAPPRG